MAVKKALVNKWTPGNLERVEDWFNLKRKHTKNDNKILESISEISENIFDQIYLTYFLHFALVADTPIVIGPDEINRFRRDS